MKHRVAVFQPYRNLSPGQEYWISDHTFRELDRSSHPAVVFEHREDEEPGDLTEVADPEKKSPAGITIAGPAIKTE